MAMSKKAFIATITISLIFVSTLVSLQTFQEVKANPFFIYHQIDQVAGTIPPNVTISSPQNGSLQTPEVNISFHVDRPILNECSTDLISINYSLDDQSFEAFSIWHGGSSSVSPIKEYRTTLVTTSLGYGNHSLRVSAEGVVNAENMSYFLIDSSSTTYFIEGNSPTPTIAPTLTSTITPVVTPTQKPTTELRSSEVLPLIESERIRENMAKEVMFRNLAITVVVLAAIALTSAITVFYFRKRRG